jgi:hypothetical protein
MSKPYNAPNYSEEELKAIRRARRRKVEKKWREKHKEESNAKQRRAYNRHVEARRKSAREKYHRMKGDFTDADRERFREYSLRHYRKYRDKCNESARKRAAERLKFMQDFKESNGCTDCKQSFPHYILEFDHRPPHTGRGPVNQLYGRCWEVLLTEIEKCDVVCANCHRIRTWKRRQEKLSSLIQESAVNTMQN